MKFSTCKIFSHCSTGSPFSNCPTCGEVNHKVKKAEARPKNGASTSHSPWKINIFVDVVAKFKTMKFNFGGLFQLFTKCPSHKNNPLYGTLLKSPYIHALLEPVQNTLVFSHTKYAGKIQFMLQIYVYMTRHSGVGRYLGAPRIRYSCTCTSHEY